jgi:hypothetical protein
MRLPALKHLIEATQALSRSERIRVLGSSALLASFPELGEPGQPLEISFDADLLIEPCDPQLAAMLHEAVGEGSLFAQRTGYHADFLRPEIVETLPADWESFVVEFDGLPKARALAPADVAAVKLRIGRPKDLQLCRHLIANQLVAPETIRRRLDAMALSESEIIRVFARFHEVSG